MTWLSILVLIIVIGYLVYFAAIIIGNYLYSGTKVVEEKEITQDEAQQIALERVISDYNYRDLNGYNLRLKSDPVSCGNDCFEFVFEYEVNQTRITGLDKIEAQIFVVDGKAKNFTYTEIASITNYQDCAAAGHEILYPDCVGCKPYCTTPDGRKFTEP